MEIKRFYWEELRAGSTGVELTGDELHHLKNVVRLSAGASVVIFNGRGLEARGVVEIVGRDAATIKVADFLQGGRGESPLSITLLQGITKGDKNELIIRKATELGVSAVIFFSTGRTVPKLSEARAASRLARFQRVAIEAAKQCQRPVVPLIALYANLNEALGEVDASLKVALWEDEEGCSLAEALRGHMEEKRAAVLVGPEGGLAGEDVAEAIGKGFIPVSAGPRRLRAETAAIAAVAILQYEAGDMGAAPGLEEEKS